MDIIGQLIGEADKAEAQVIEARSELEGAKSNYREVAESYDPTGRATGVLGSRSPVLIAVDAVTLAEAALLRAESVARKARAKLNAAERDGGTIAALVKAASLESFEADLEPIRERAGEIFRQAGELFATLNSVIARHNSDIELATNKLAELDMSLRELRRVDVVDQIGRFREMLTAIARAEDIDPQAAALCSPWGL